MSHTVISKHSGNRILLITLSDPFDFRNEPIQYMNELHTLLGSVTNTLYLIYDARNLTINIEGIINSVSTFAHPRADFEKQLNTHSRMIFVGTGTFIKLGAKTAGRFAPQKAFPVFDTVDQALDYARAELAK